MLSLLLLIYARMRFVVVVVVVVVFYHAVDVLERALTQRTKPRCFFISSEEPDTKSTTSVGSKGAKD